MDIQNILLLAVVITAVIIAIIFAVRYKTLSKCAGCNGDCAHCHGNFTVDEDKNDDK